MKTLSYQVKEEGVQAGAKTHRGQNTQANPVSAPQRLLLHVANILQRPERGTVNHMAEAHAQRVRKTRNGGGGAERGGEEQRQSERRYESESVQNTGHFKGWERACEW